MPAPGRRRPSTVDRLDPEVKELIGRLRIDKGYTIDEIREQLEKMLAAELLPSRSALGRHVKSIEDVGAQLKHSREVAAALVQQVGDAPEDRMADLNIELMHTMMLRLLTATNDEGDGQPVTFGAEDVMFLSRSLQSLASAKKTNADMVIKVRDLATKEAAKKAVDAAKSKGLSGDTVEFIRKAVLGSDG
ncbi:DUF3486 family protein [Sphingomonas gilva]|uniref:DUF3486 family protein n=1 Tax=Sphingomonas gilva TaxID=2305907 RepID=A0A396RLJ8_9SPHN|nr:DUF3486 family protein [Sphingomonas gilva]RHW17188.1 DUF3486 family protein [Sphingomonas gilva]